MSDTSSNSSWTAATRRSLLFDLDMSEEKKRKQTKKNSKYCYILFSSWCCVGVVWRMLPGVELRARD